MDVPRGRRVLIRGRRSKPLEQGKHEEGVGEGEGHAEEVQEVSSHDRPVSHITLSGMDAYLHSRDISTMLHSCYRAYAQHIVYILGLLPGPFEQVQQQLQSQEQSPSHNSTRSRMKDQKLSIFLSSLDLAINDTMLLFMSGQVDSAFLGIGSAVSNLKLLFQLHFPTDSECSSSFSSDISIPKRLQDRAKRSLLQTLVSLEHNTSTNYKVPPTGQIFLFYKLHNTNAAINCAEGQYVSQTFSLPCVKRRKKVRGMELYIHIIDPIAAADISSGMQGDTSMDCADNSDCTWILPLRGIRYQRYSTYT
jgi:hypothetical protein